MKHSPLHLLLPGFVLVCGLALCAFPCGAENGATPAGKPSASSRVFPVTPVKKPNGSKWRIAYFRSGEFKNYPLNIKAAIRGLETLGWLKLPAAIPETLTGQALWRFLAQNTQSAYVELVADAFYEPGDFDAGLRPVIRDAIWKRLREKADVDLMIAMGTWAGQDMVALGVPVPTVVLSVSDPMGSGIIKSPWDSGHDNLNARVYPERYRRQVQIFNDIIPFRKLGLIYEDSLEGRTYSAIDDVRLVAERRGFAVAACEAPFSDLPPSLIEQKALDCYEKLAREVDAVYVTVHRGMSGDAITRAAEIFRQAKIPSFSMQGPDEVKAGILMSMAQADFSYIGLFHAETIARIFNGAQPRQLTQIWADPEKIALNLKTARLIGFDPPVDILLAADEVYEIR